MRNLHGADLVGMIVSNRDDYCGCGSLPMYWNPKPIASAFFVSTYECSTSTVKYSFAHELSHSFVSEKKR